jgi:hypothetical protein
MPTARRGVIISIVPKLHKIFFRNASLSPLRPNLNVGTGRRVITNEPDKGAGVYDEPQQGRTRSDLLASKCAILR